MSKIIKTFGRKVSPISKEQIYSDDSLRAYVEDQMNGAIKMLAREKYETPITAPIEVKVDGRLKKTMISVKTWNNLFRFNSTLFTESKTRIIELLDEAVKSYLEHGR